MTFAWGRPVLLPFWTALVAPVGCLTALLVLNSQREITALESDASVAIYMSLGYLNGTFPPLYPPGLSFFITTMKSLGMPLRVANVILTFSCSTFVCFLLLIRMTDFRQRLIASSLFGLFFSSIPTIVYEGDITGNVFFSGLCNLLLFALVAFAAQTRRVDGFIAVLIIAGLAGISRPDSEITLLTLVACPFAVVVLSKDRKSAFIRSSIVVGAAIVAILAAQQAVKRFNVATYGVDGVANYLDTRYSDFFASVAALPSKEPTDRFFLGDKSRRELAYSLSPTLNSYRNLIEDDTGAGAIGFNAGVQFFGKRDIANAFYFWHLDNVFEAAKISLPDYLTILGRSASEIKQAANAQQIPLSNPYFGVLARGYDLWLPYVLPGIQKAYKYSFQERPSAVRYGQTSAELAQAYDRAALRRSALLKNGEGVYPAPILAGFYNNLHAVVFYAFMALMPATLLVMFFDRSALSRVRWMFLLMLGSFVTRILYYGLLDASFYRATANYLNPNFILVYFLTLGAMLIIFDAVVRRRTSRMANSIGQIKPSPVC